MELVFHVQSGGVSFLKTFEKSSRAEGVHESLFGGCSLIIKSASSKEQNIPAHDPSIQVKIESKNDFHTSD